MLPKKLQDEIDEAYDDTMTAESLCGIIDELYADLELAMEALEQYQHKNFVAVPSSPHPESAPMDCFIGDHVAEKTLTTLRAKYKEGE